MLYEASMQSLDSGSSNMPIWSKWSVQRNVNTWAGGTEWEGSDHQVLLGLTHLWLLIESSLTSCQDSICNTEWLTTKTKHNPHKIINISFSAGLNNHWTFPLLYSHYMLNRTHIISLNNHIWFLTLLIWQNHIMS